MTASYDPVFGRQYERKQPHGWQRYGACVGIDVNVFITSNEEGDRSGHKARKAAIEAKRVCRRCEVVAECLEYAMAEPAEKHGVWGATTPAERRDLAALRSLRRKGLAS